MQRTRAELALLVREAAGLDPPAWALEARERERAAALGLAEDEYAGRAAGDAGELARLVELLRVGETRFFRHRAQLQALGERVLPSLRGPVAAWSAGCSSGEEAWTLAILLAERGLPFSLWATDLSTVALARAREGRYPAARVEAEVPAPLVPRYFRPIGEERVLNDRLRPHVRFDAHNLLASVQGREFDLVLCRNVLIYFDEAARAEAVAGLVRVLKPGGWLLVGYSETLRDCGELTAEGHALFRKRAPAAMATPGPATKRMAAATAAAHPSSLHRTMAAGSAAYAGGAASAAIRRVLLRGDYLDGKRLAAELRSVVGESRALVDLDGVSFLGDDAARVLRRAVEAAPGLEVRATRAPVRRWLARHGIRVK
ncbi:MAG: protein-glutamate O-methyltransferase CheR [Myxococcales bacterium]|nr:protein-glutamate O-methyltransferase CheR [Myxococcales bacterium]